MGEPWQPLKLYYSHGFSRAAWWPSTSTARPRPRVAYAEWLERWQDDRKDGLRVTSRVRCDQWFPPVRDEALKAHATQIDPTSRWFFVPPEIQSEVWPTEDYELVRSLVDSPTPEDDLFAGLVPSADTVKVG